MNIKNIEFHFSPSEHIIYDMESDLFTFTGQLPNQLLNYFIKNQINDTILRLKIIKGLKYLKNTIINTSEEIISKYQEHLTDNCTNCNRSGFVSCYEDNFKCGLCDFEKFIYDLIPINS